MSKISVSHWVAAVFTIFSMRSIADRGRGLIAITDLGKLGRKVCVYLIFEINGMTLIKFPGQNVSVEFDDLNKVEGEGAAAV